MAVKRERERESIIRASEGNGVSETERGKLFFFAVAWPRDDHLHIGPLPPPPPPLIDKYTGGAPRNEGPPPPSLLLYFFQRGPPLSVNSFDVDQLLYLPPFLRSSLSSSSFPPTFVPFVHPVCYAALRCDVPLSSCRFDDGMGTRVKERGGKRERKKKREKKKKIVTGK